MSTYKLASGCSQYGVYWWHSHSVFEASNEYFIDSFSVIQNSGHCATEISIQYFINYWDQYSVFFWFTSIHPKIRPLFHWDKFSVFYWSQITDQYSVFYWFTSSHPKIWPLCHWDQYSVFYWSLRSIFGILLITKISIQYFIDSHLVIQGSGHCATETSSQYFIDH